MKKRKAARATTKALRRVYAETRPRKKGGDLMAKKGKRSRRQGFTIPLAVIGGLVPTAAFAAEGLKVGGPVEAAKRASMRLTGYNPWEKQWYFSEFAAGWLPILAGVVAHKLANRTGINRAIASAGIPLLRI